MIIWGKKVNNKKINTIDNLYTVYRDGQDPSILLPKTRDLKEYIKICKINNAIYKKEKNYYRFWIGERKYPETKNNWHWSYNGVFSQNFFLIKDGNIKHYQTLCEICKDKLKGIVEECKDQVYLSSKERDNKHCIFSLEIPDTEMDLQELKRISLGLLNEKNPFKQHSSLEEIDFNIDTIKRNLIRFKDKYQCSKLKQEKIKKWCDKCIFSCEEKIINTSNVKNKCCLTYKQAFKNGFFKEIKLHTGTSIYRNGVYIKGCNILKSWNGNFIPLSENEYNNYGRDKTKI